MAEDALLALVRKRLRIASSAFDDDIGMHIEAAKRRLLATGIKLIMSENDNYDPLIVDAITTYVRAQYAPDNENADRYAQSFESFLQFLSVAGEYNGTLE